MVRCEIVSGFAENAFPWKLLFAFPFPNGIGDRDGARGELLEPVCNKSPLESSIS